MAVKSVMFMSPRNNTFPLAKILLLYYQFVLIRLTFFYIYRDNSKLCSCGGDRQVYYWDVASGRVIRKFRGHDSEVNAVKFNEYSSVVVSAGYDRSVRAWDCRSHSTEPIQVLG